MNRSLVREYLSALDISVIGLHYLASGWQVVAPGVAANIRKIADQLAARAKKTRSEMDPQVFRRAADFEPTKTTHAGTPGALFEPERRSSNGHVPFDVAEFPTELLDAPDLDADPDEPTPPMGTGPLPPFDDDDDKT